MICIRGCQDNFKFQNNLLSSMKNIKFLFALGGFLIINSCAQQTLPKSQSDFALIVSGVNADAELPSTYASQSCAYKRKFSQFYMEQSSAKYYEFL